MAGRLNLAGLNCEELRIITHMELSTALIERISAESHSHSKDKVLQFAMFGSVYTANKVPHVAEAQIERVDSEYHVEFTYLVEKRSRPPKDVKAVWKLAALLAEEPKDCLLECHARFRYDEKDGWRSAIEIPMPVPVSDQRVRPFTHVEAIRFSRREQENIDHSIQIQRTRSGYIEHRVYLAEPCTEAITEQLQKRLLRRSKKISELFIRKEQEEKHGN